MFITPTLLRLSPAPLLKIVGDLGERQNLADLLRPAAIAVTDLASRQTQMCERLGIGCVFTSGNLVSSIYFWRTRTSENGAHHIYPWD